MASGACDPFWEVCDQSETRPREEIESRPPPPPAPYILEPESLLVMAPLEGQLMYLLVATVQVTGYMMLLFKFRGASADGKSFYEGVAQGQLSEASLWQSANLALSYAKASIFGVAALMQLLALFGVGAEINQTIWVIGAAYINFLVILGYLSAEYVVWDSLRSKVD